MQFAITIDGLGKGANLYYFGSWVAPSWDSNSVWIPRSLELWPRELAQEANWTAGIATISGGEFVVVGAQRATSSDPYVEQLLYTQRPVSLGNLTTAITTAAQSTIATDVTDGSLASTRVLLGREVIGFGTHSGSGTYGSCTRGERGTLATEHPLTEVRKLYDADYPAGGHVRHRRVQLYRIPESATQYSDAVLLWTGVVQTISEDQPGRIVIGADGLLTVLSQLTICHNLWRLQGTVTPGGSSAFVSGTGLGETAASSGEIYLSTGDSVVEGVAFSGTLNSRPNINGRFNLSGRSAPGDETKEAWECYRTSGSGDTDDLPLDTNVFYRCLQHLTTTPWGGNGSYDINTTPTNPSARRAALGAAIPASLVDVTRFELMARVFGPLAEQDSYIGVDGKPIPLADHLSKLLAPYNCCLVERGGKISVALMTDGLELTPPTLAEADLKDAPGQSRLLTWGLDEIEATWGAAPGIEPTTDTFREGRQARLNVYGGLGTIDLDMSGVQSRQRAASLAGLVLQRRAMQPNRVSCTILRTSGTTLKIGSVVTFTHSLVRGPLGTRGVTSAKFLVESITQRHDTAEIVLELLDMQQLYSGDNRRIAPSAVVGSYDGGTKTITTLSGASGFASGDVYATDADSFATLDGAWVSICSRKHVEAGVAEISSVGTNSIVIKNETTTPTAGQIIKLADYDYVSQIASAQDPYAWLADASNEVGGDATAFAEWVMISLVEDA